MDPCIGVLLFVGMRLQDAASRRPPELARANHARSMIRSGSIEWSVLPGDGAPGEDARYYSSTLAEADHMVRYRGLITGQRLPDPEKIGKPLAFAEDTLLLKDGEQWSHMQDSIFGGVAVDHASFVPYCDLRDLGFEPSSAATNVDIWYRYPPDRCEVDRTARMVVVTEHWNNELSVRLTLDPDKDMQPVRAAVLVGDRETNVCSTTYAQTDGIWFPVEAVFTYEGARQMTIKVLNAEFNQPDQPTSLTPADMGMVPGVQVVQAETLVPFAWTGEQLIPLDDWYALVREDKVDHAQFDELLRKSQTPEGQFRFPKGLLDASTATHTFVPRSPGLWEEFTRRYIQFCSFSPEQQREAWRILRVCQKRANPLLVDIRREADQIQEELGRDPGASSPVSTTRISDSPPSAAQGHPDGRSASGETGSSSEGLAPDSVSISRAVALTAKLERLWKPIEFIFERGLKPDLYKLLTNEQRENVAQHDAKLKSSSSVPNG